jgi:adenylosuccinate synthase
LRRAVFTNSVAGLCLTKLDVLDGLPEIKICVGYRLDGKVHNTPPLLIDRFGECEPVYESVAGWSEPTAGATSYAALPKEAKAYLERLEELAEVPIDIVSTGPSRDAVIMRRHPFD